MNFALLGTDPDSIALAQAAEVAGHAIVWCGDIADACPLMPGWPAEDLGGEWEALLDQSTADAVIVGRGQATASLRAEQVNLLTKNGVAILTTFPLVDSVLSYYEIDMSRGESDGILLHFNPLKEQHTILDECREWIADGHPELGAVEQVVWERTLVERTQERVLWHFSRDVELLSLLDGRLNRLGALGSPDEAATYAGLSVQLLGKSEVPMRWQVGPVEKDSASRLVLIAERGKMTLDFDKTGHATQLTMSHDGESHITELQEVDAASNAVQRFVDAIVAGNGSASTWPQALAAMELTDTIEISLRRGRMIEVHQQQLTEQMAFKGTMSALGCGVLLLLPPLLLFLGWAAELLGLPWAKSWSYVLLGLLVAFLSLQLIPKLLFKR
ncbi:MAG: hypothetical protein GXP24_03095 [Planctomycetes bacterium]|nr:hypothetical protein [Planctomycetota bacterium]